MHQRKDDKNKQCGRLVRPTRYAPVTLTLTVWPWFHKVG